MNTAAKLTEKRALLVARTAAALGVTTEEAERLFAVSRLSSFRINRLKVDDDLSLLAELATEGWVGTQSKLYELGYGISSGRPAVVNSQAVTGGHIFIQNQASWLPVLALEPQPGDKILDICAAPGGKASFIAELTNNQAELWINDNSRARLFKLRANFARLGARYSEMTMYGIDRLPHVLPLASFDKILLDAPCSGEGMITLSRDKDFEYWSLAQIKRLQQLQKKGIMAAWKLLKPGGTLIYSTCTMAPEENEAVVDYLLCRQEDAELMPIQLPPIDRRTPVAVWKDKTFKSDLADCLRIAPGELLEAFFVAKVHKRYNKN